MDLTDSKHTNYLIKLLMMLPAPDSEEAFPMFWDSVAKEHGVSRSYVTGKISVHLKLLLGTEATILHRRQLASYALFFFGEASTALVRDITSEIDVGAPNTSAGQVWVQELRANAFAVIEESFSDDRVLEAVSSWVRLDTQ
ncbi:hypothetical protein IDM40_08320 [Nocardiopsis sp. HNM0947]|uniref:Uncharacterized protein n=1 Tax=Nocardiopsis coralli TaxID=2772213 RepID=A0ABR9P4D8_9ACTN|nr:hypothetical protein [Nocardiopsis coralli]MBE2998705.1 hypothetical protein [Nocardiopsis coralli]